MYNGELVKKWSLNSFSFGFCFNIQFWTDCLCWRFFGVNVQLIIWFGRKKKIRWICLNHALFTHKHKWYYNTQLPWLSGNALVMFYRLKFFIVFIRRKVNPRICSEKLGEYWEITTTKNKVIATEQLFAYSSAFNIFYERHYL